MSNPRHLQRLTPPSAIGYGWFKAQICRTWQTAAPQERNPARLDIPARSVGRSGALPNPGERLRATRSEIPGEQDERSYPHLDEQRTWRECRAVPEPS